MNETVPKTICLFGPQGSGKGTQAERMSQTFGIPILSPGHMFRSAIANGTELGKKIEAVYNAGNLIPDEITNALIKERLEQEDCQQGFILDGYPRNAVQADALDSMTTLSYVFEIVISDEEAIERISNRRSCLQCGATYHLIYKAPQQPDVCDRCGSALVQRDDDKPEAIRQRLQIYATQTKPLLQRYAERGILQTIDGMGTIDEVWEMIKRVLAQG